MGEELFAMIPILMSSVSDDYVDQVRIISMLLKTIYEFFLHECLHGIRVFVDYSRMAFGRYLLHMIVTNARLRR